MRKVADFSTYKHLQKMSFADFNRWVISVYKSGYADGADEESKKYEDNSLTLNEDSLYDILITVPGIGEKLANKIIERMVEVSENQEQ
jgi:DNA uptake protein ComE-like DNA-binding protein